MQSRDADLLELLFAEVGLDALRAAFESPEADLPKVIDSARAAVDAFDAHDVLAYAADLLAGRSTCAPEGGFDALVVGAELVREGGRATLDGIDPADPREPFIPSAAGIVLYLAANP